MDYNTKQMLMASISGEWHKCAGDLQAEKILLLLCHGKNVVYTAVFGYHRLRTKQLPYRACRHTWPQRTCAAYAVASIHPMVHATRQWLQQAHQPQTEAHGQEYAQVRAGWQITNYKFRIPNSKF